MNPYTNILTSGDYQKLAGCVALSRCKLAGVLSGNDFIKLALGTANDITPAATTPQPVNNITPSVTPQPAAGTGTVNTAPQPAGNVNGNQQFYNGMAQQQAAPPQPNNTGFFGGIKNRIGNSTVGKAYTGVMRAGGNTVNRYALGRAAARGIGSLGKVVGGPAAFAASMGVNALGNGLANRLGSYETVGGTAAHTATNAANYALTGAMIGSFVPGLGTGIGAGIGALAGLGKGVYEAYYKAPKLMKEYQGNIKNLENQYEQELMARAAQVAPNRTNANPNSVKSPAWQKALLGMTKDEFMAKQRAGEEVNIKDLDRAVAVQNLGRRYQLY